MIRLLLCLERLSFNEKEGNVIYRYGKEGEEVELTDYLESIARISSKRTGTFFNEGCS